MESNNVPVSVNTTPFVVVTVVGVVFCLTTLIALLAFYADFTKSPW